MTKRPAIQSATVPLAIVVTAGCLISFLTFGPRSAMGFFQLPVLEDNQWDRVTFGLAMAIQNLMWGLGQPIFGAIADRYGTARVLVLGAILYALGLVTMAWAPTPLWLHIGAGALVGLGIAAGSFGILLAAFARRVSAENRSLVFGLGTAAGSAGMFVFAPLSQAMIASLGWADTLVYFAAFMGLIPIAAVALRGKPDTSAEASEFRRGVRDALAQAFAHKSYLLLTAGFFVCGFQVAFITAHFPAYISDLGLAQKWAVVAIMAIGFFNIIGCLASGVIGQRSKSIHGQVITGVRKHTDTCHCH
jgi:MFS family permease